jgi:hypothetical protein
MIELNCSYEESKKILELGYDFSKVCWKSLYEYRDQYNLNQTFIRIHLHGTGLFLTSIEDEISYRMSKYGIIDLVTPVIPKAALEACLPDYLLKKGCNRHFSLFYHVRKFMGELYWVNSRDESLTENWFSPYEAFRWCHEHYPEELRKKFEEVMK